VDARIEKVWQEATARKGRHEASLLKHTAAVRDRQARDAQQRSQRSLRQQHIMSARLEQELAKRAETAQRSARYAEREEQRRARQEALVASRRAATMQFAQLKAHFSEQQERAQIRFGLTSDSGRRELEQLYQALTLVDDDRRPATSHGAARLATVPPTPRAS
jgi:hypothetical protein